MSTIDKIKKEIERRIDTYINLRTKPEMSDLDGELASKIEGYRSLLGFIESLEQEPTFKVGDTIIAKDGTAIPKEPFHIDRIDDGRYWDENNEILIVNQDEFELYSPKIRGWIARDKNGKLNLFSTEPFRSNSAFSDWYPRDEIAFALDSHLFPNLLWESDPIEVELIMNRV